VTAAQTWWDNGER